SRRRHTRSKRDWSSDVCSSDLDEGVHGFYIGYKFQQVRAGLDSFEQETLDSAVRKLLISLYEIEVKYTEFVYDPIGWTENVKKYLQYYGYYYILNIRFYDIITC